MRYSELIEARFPRVPSTETLAGATQAGFDTKLWYHGTRRRFDGFQLPTKPGHDELGPGVYVTSRKWLANTWARERGFVLTCVIRAGPLFNLAYLNRPETKKILAAGYHAFQKERWGEARLVQDAQAHGDDLFEYVWKTTRDQVRLANLCLSAAGYVGGYKHDSQIEGQVVVFKPEDVMIVARSGGQSYMSSFD
jgi:hypothetical protein